MYSGGQATIWVAVFVLAKSTLQPRKAIMHVGHSNKNLAYILPQCSLHTTCVFFFIVKIHVLPQIFNDTIIFNFYIVGTYVIQRPLGLRKHMPCAQLKKESMQSSSNSSNALGSPIQFHPSTCHEKVEGKKEKNETT
jgi:hypothetical protein